MSKVYKDPYGFEYQRDLLSFLEDVEIETVSNQVPEIVTHSKIIGDELNKKEEILIELGEKRKDLYFNQEVDNSKEIKYFLFKKKEESTEQNIQKIEEQIHNENTKNRKLNLKYRHNYTYVRTTVTKVKSRSTRGKFLTVPLTLKSGFNFVSKTYTTKEEVKKYIVSKLSNVTLCKSDKYLEMLTINNYVGNKKLDIREIYLDDKEMIDIFFNQNINLVWKCVQKINYPSKEDLYQVACIGMYDAIKKFDKSKGVKFSTLGYQKINAAIFRYLENHSRAIRLPSHIYQRKMKISKAKSELEKLNKEINLDTIAEATKLSKKDIEFIEKNSLDTVSMYNQSDSSEKEGELASTVHFSVEDYSEQVCRDIHNSQIRSKLYKIFKEYLTEIEMNVLIKTFYEQKSAKEISVELDLEHTKVSQIKNKTLRVLKKVLPSKGITLSSLY